MSIDEGVNKLYVGRKVVIVIEFTPPKGEREGKSKIQNWALFWNIYGSGKSNILLTANGYRSGYFA